MMRVALLALTVSITPGAACAQTFEFRPPYGDMRSWTGSWESVGSRIHRSGNDCGPDRATPVWGRNNAFVGYACESESANGS